jgi:hypothetical protein
MLRVEFEPAIPASNQAQALTSDPSVTGIGEKKKKTARLFYSTESAEISENIDWL